LLTERGEERVIMVTMAIRLPTIMHSLLFFYLASTTTTSMSMSLVSGWSLSPITSTIIGSKSSPISSRKWRQQQQQHHFPLYRHYNNFRLYNDNINFGKEDTNDDEVEDDNIEENDSTKHIEYFDDFDFVIGENTDTSYVDDTSRENDDNNNINNNKDEEIIFPNQSEAMSSSPSSSYSSMLNQRFQALALNEQLNRQQISDNWKDGYWGVWGCSLAGEDNNDEKTIVTCLRRAVSVFDDDDDDDDNDVTLLIVGRSDGSICSLQMETISSQTYDKTTTNNNVDNRSMTTYFENKLVAKETDNGGMIVDTALQRDENNNIDNDIDDDDDDRSSSSSQSPFEILSQIQTSSSSSAAIVDMLILPAACRMIWTISHDSPNTIQGWKLIPNEETGFLIPISSTSSSSSSSEIKIDIETIHTSPIVAMKIIPKINDESDDADDDDSSSSTFIISVSDNGQAVVWEVISSGGGDSEPSQIKIRLDADLLRQQQEDEEEYDDQHTDYILSMEVDDQYLYLGSQTGRISIFALSTIIGDEEDLNTPTGPLQSLPLAKSFLAFNTKEPGVSTICAAGPGTLGDTADVRSSNNGRPPSKTLIAGNVGGGIKQWELIQAGIGRLEYWPRMASQRLPKGKTHVYETKEGRDNYDYGDYDDDDDDQSSSSSIRGLLCIQQVLLAATDHGLTFWDSKTGKALYDMQGLKFSALGGERPDGNNNSNSGSDNVLPRPNLVAINDSVLVTNGMDQYVCVHDFSMDRFSSGENADGDDYDDW
jgi:hypothetical protein